MALAERDVRLALGVVEAAASTQNGDPFGEELLGALLEAVPAESAEYFEWTFHEEFSFRMCVPYDPWALSDLGEAVQAACRTYPLRDVDHSSSAEPLRISDLASTRAFRKTAWHSLVMRPLCFEHEVKLWLPASPRRARCFSLLRGHGRDFDAREVALLRLIRPYLARLRTRWERAPRPAQLTEREHDVLELVAQGLTNREVARRLVVAPTTVRTHLEHIYEKLGVRTRAGAVAAAFRAAS